MRSPGRRVGRDPVRSAQPHRCQAVRTAQPHRPPRTAGLRPRPAEPRETIDQVASDMRGLSVVGSRQIGKARIARTVQPRGPVAFDARWLGVRIIPRPSESSQVAVVLALPSRCCQARCLCCHVPRRSVLLGIHTGAATIAGRTVRLGRGHRDGGVASVERTDQPRSQNSMTLGSRLVAREAPSVAFRLGPGVLAAGPAHTTVLLFVCWTISVIFGHGASGDGGVSRPCWRAARSASVAGLRGCCRR